MIGVVRLRDVLDSDLPIFFQQQLDTQANYMAAFTAPRNPADQDAFMAHWEQLRLNDEIYLKTIIFNEQVAGNIVSFVISGEREVGYWIGKEYWGKDIATRALRKFLDFLEERPLYAHAAKDNAASLRVLEKNGFKICGEGKLFAYARGKEVEECVLKLERHTDKIQNPKPGKLLKKTYERNSQKTSQLIHNNKQLDRGDCYRYA